MKVLALTKYGMRGASSRVRTFQFLPYLRSAGIDVDVDPLFDDLYLDKLYKYGSRSRVLSIVPSYWNRLSTLVAVRRYDVVWIEKELFPYLPAFAECFFATIGTKYVVDYDDALFHQYDLHRYVGLRWLLSQKIDHVMSSASTVVAGNQYLADRARQANAKHVEILPSVIGLPETLPRPCVKSHEDQVVVGWIGSPSTTKYLHLITQALRVVQRRYGVRVRLVGAAKLNLPGLAYEQIDWCEQTEQREIAKFDIGVMPLADGPWERGKCGYKLIQYMGKALPVIASPVGANLDIVEDGIQGLFAHSNKEWIDALTRLIVNPKLRARMGAAGCKLVSEKYCTAVAAPKLIEIFNRCGDS